MSELVSVLAVVAGIVALASGVFLAVFFATGDDRWGHANDLMAAMFSVMLVPVAISLGSRFSHLGPVSWLVAGFGVLALVVSTIASTLTGLGRLTVGQLATYQGGSFMAVFAWMAATSVLILIDGSLPSALGLLGLGIVGILTAAAVVAGIAARRAGGWDRLFDEQRPPIASVVLGIVALLAFPAWLIWLGISLA